MFTGIIEQKGKIQRIDRHPKGARFQITSSHLIDQLRIGESISVNGCCLTLIDHHSTQMSFDLVEETLNRTNLKSLKEGDSVNLERALQFSDRIGGHFVQGHIDGIGKMIEKLPLPDHSWWITIQAPHEIQRYLIFKGSIAVEGVSLTIAHLEQESFSFAMIPHTAQVTTLGLKQVGDEVNLEIDFMAKYVERFINPLKSFTPS